MNEIEWRPETIRFGNGGSALLDGLVRTAGAEFFDTIDAQLRDLVKARHPGVRMSPEELDRAVLAHLDGRDRRAYGVWVFYPWSRRLVHLLDEAEFAELRTNRNRNKMARLGNLWVELDSGEGSVEVAAEFAAGGLEGSLLFF
jgi:hypothetical protein